MTNANATPSAKAVCGCGQTLDAQTAPNGSCLRVVNCLRCGTSNWVADNRPAEG